MTTSYNNFVYALNTLENNRKNSNSRNKSNALRENFEKILNIKPGNLNWNNRYLNLKNSGRNYKNYKNFFDALQKGNINAKYKLYKRIYN